MKYLLDCANDNDVKLEISQESDFVRLEINDKSTKDYKEFYLTKVDVYNLIGVLHHIQKQFKLQD